MSKKTTIIILLFLASFFILSSNRWGVFGDKTDGLEEEKILDNNLEVAEKTAVEKKSEEEVKKSESQENGLAKQSPSEINAPEEKDVLLSVPFTAQAPTGNWKDPRQQDACEEASSLMAVKWTRGETIDPLGAEREILDIVAFEEKNYGVSHDTSAADTAERIIKGYFGYENFRVEENMDLSEIKKELFKGYVVIVPVNGQALGNPYFTQPGPERHMLVIIGYDSRRRQFIANDSGTRRGAKYRYTEDILYAALRDYPTGDHVPLTERKKSMIVVKK